MGRTTEITLANGRSLVVQGTHDDVKAACGHRTLTVDDGFRTMRTVDGDNATFNAAAVTLIRETSGATKQAFGFAQALEGTA